MSRPSARSSSPRSARPLPPESEGWLKPWVQMKYFSFQPNVYPNMITSVSPEARRGEVVAVYDKTGKLFGHGFYNPGGRVPLRICQHGEQPLAEDHFQKVLREAVALRLEVLRLPETTDAFRVVHADADRVPGLMVDKLGDVLAIEVSNATALRRVGEWAGWLQEWLGTKHLVVHMDESARRAESLSEREVEDALGPLQQEVATGRIMENGMRFHVDFEHGHKTGFFCDQRDNRAQWGRWVKGRRVLDVCCYTGGFSVAAKLGGASEVTGVDLDEKAIEVAKKNANLNQQRISFVHADAFSWMRQMQRNGATWEAVILDPPKLIHSREGFEEGKAKYHDLNKLALSLVEPGGLFATCSCSGLMPVETFEEIVTGVAHRSGRKLQILDRTGAGPDHPVMSNCPDSRYLKVLWARVW